ncbi:hypothetical protein EVAR_61760_1 [Eumeta japonica]|uniref:Uncharacterized protein n=1 Tax=Eumeta variegata TaxID=151549 RepID=A0A4C1ZED8_EUMVA|nr:hypothetical protein EVAR_61760_1 [Eumeta japonica]
MAINYPVSQTEMIKEAPRGVSQIIPNINTRPTNVPSDAKKPQRLTIRRPASTTEREQTHAARRQGPSDASYAGDERRRALKEN